MAPCDIFVAHFETFSLIRHNLPAAGQFAQIEIFERKSFQKLIGLDFQVFDKFTIWQSKRGQKWVPIWTWKVPMNQFYHIRGQRGVHENQNVHDAEIMV